MLDLDSRQPYHIHRWRQHYIERTAEASKSQERKPWMFQYTKMYKFDKSKTPDHFTKHPPLPLRHHERMATKFTSIETENSFITF